MNIDPSIGIAVVSGVFGIIQAFLSKNKEKKNEAQMNLIKESIATNSNYIDILKSKADKNEEDHNLRRDLKNLVNEISTNKIVESELLVENMRLVSSLIDYFDSISDFSLKFYYADWRYSEKITTKQFETYLQFNLDAIMLKFINALNMYVTDEKSIKAGNNFHYTNFTEFFATALKDSNQTDCFGYNKKLSNELALNGFDDKGNDVKTKFIEYVNNWMDTFKDIFKRYYKLEDYDAVIEKRAEFI